MSQTGPRKAYVIQQITWEYNDENFFFTGEKVVKAYRNRDRAEDELRKKESRFRAQCEEGPISFAGSLADATRLPEEEVVEALATLGVEPPPRQTTARGGPYRQWWRPEWWSDALDAVGPDREDELWAIFDKVRDHQLVEIDLSEEDAA